MHAFDRGAVAGTTRGQIDTIDHVDGSPGLVFHPKPTVASHGAPVLVSGWTVDPATDAAPLAVVVLLDKVRELRAVTGIARGDIMVNHGTDEFVGFLLAIDTTDLGTGAHELRVYALAGDGFWYESASTGFRLYHDVVPSKETLNRPLRMALDGRVDLTAGRHLKPGSPVRGNHWVQLQGWTYDLRTHTGAARIAAIDEDGRMWSGPSNVERPDVGAAMLVEKPQLGFEIVIPAAVFSRGSHQLRIVGYDNAGRPYANALDVEFHVIAEAHRFPLTARRLTEPGSAGGVLHILGTTDEDDGDDTVERTLLFSLPAGDIAVNASATLRIDGWALNARGGAAEDVYLEISPRWATVPPQRLPVDSGWFESEFENDSVAGGIEGSFFTATLSAELLVGGAHELAIVVVQPDRCSYTHASIATISVRTPQRSPSGRRR